jgi:hypothetical protein
MPGSIVKRENGAEWAAHQEVLSMGGLHARLLPEDRVALFVDAIVTATGALLPCGAVGALPPRAVAVPHREPAAFAIIGPPREETTSERNSLTERLPERGSMSPRI